MTESSSSPRRTPPRRPPGKGGPGRGASSPIVELAAIETPPELILFNAYLSAEKDLERERQRVRQAEVAKDKAAARLKELQSGGSSEEIKAAEAEYRQLVEAWKRVRDGEVDEPAGDGGAGAGDALEAGSDDVAGGEAAAQDEPGDVAGADTADDVTVDGEPAETVADAGSGETEDVAASEGAEDAANNGTVEDPAAEVAVAETEEPGDTPKDDAAEGDEA